MDFRETAEQAMLREAVARVTDVGREAKSIMEAGKLVSDEIINRIVAERIHSGSPPRTMAIAIATPIKAPSTAEARLTLMEIQ